VLTFPELKKIVVVDGEASELKIFNYNTYELIGHTELTIDADPAVYDPATKLMYVVNGGRAAKTPYCLDLMEFLYQVIERVYSTTDRPCFFVPTLG
jgi:hypothetical protein